MVLLLSSYRRAPFALTGDHWLGWEPTGEGGERGSTTVGIGLAFTLEKRSFMLSCLGHILTVSSAGIDDITELCHGYDHQGTSDVLFSFFYSHVL